MEPINRALILSVSAGSGHIKAGEAVKEALLEKNPQAQIEMVDAFKYASPLLDKVIIGTYMEIIKFSPLVYGYFYRRAESKAVADFGKKEFTKILNMLMSAKLEKLIEDFNPQVIICTHPFPLGVMATLKKKSRLHIPLAAVVTDFTIHPFWLFNEVDLFFVAAEELAEEIIAKGIYKEKVKITGIPIAKKFSEINNSQRLKSKLNLVNDLPIVLVMGGGMGMGPISKIFKSLINMDLPMQMVVIVGNNQSLYHKLQSESIESKIPIKIFGFVDNVHEFMEVSDLIVTKPGGLTTSEALAKGLPLIIIDPIPGQEERNTEFLVKASAAVKVDNEESLAQVLEYFLDKPEEIKEMKEMAIKIGKPWSTDKVVDSLMILCNSY